MWIDQTLIIFRARLTPTAEIRQCSKDLKGKGPYKGRNGVKRGQVRLKMSQKGGKRA